MLKTCDETSLLSTNSLKLLVSYIKLYFGAGVQITDSVPNINTNDCQRQNVQIQIVVPGDVWKYLEIFGHHSTLEEQQQPISCPLSGASRSCGRQIRGAMPDMVAVNRVCRVYECTSVRVYECRL